MMYPVVARSLVQAWPQLATFGEKCSQYQPILTYTNLHRHNCMNIFHFALVSQFTQGGRRRNSLMTEVIHRSPTANPTFEKPTIVMPFRSKEEGFINVHVDDTVEEVIDEKDDLILARTSRGRTGWFKAECVRWPSIPREMVDEHVEWQELERKMICSACAKRVNMTRLSKRPNVPKQWRRQIVGDLTLLNEEEVRLSIL